MGAIVCSLGEWVICNWMRGLGSRKVRVHVEVCNIHVEAWGEHCCWGSFVVSSQGPSAFSRPPALLPRRHTWHDTWHMGNTWHNCQTASCVAVRLVARQSASSAQSTVNRSAEQTGALLSFCHPYLSSIPYLYSSYHTCIVLQYLYYMYSSS